MTTLESKSNGVILRGLDGSNPLGFLAALGTLRTLALALPKEAVKMSWVESDGGWRPSVTRDRAVSEREIVECLRQQLKSKDEHGAFSFSDNLSVSPDEFRTFATNALAGAHRCSEPSRRTVVDFAAAFACDLLVNEQGKIQDTALRTMSGAGHQHFLAFMRQIVQETNAEHLQKSLFDTWTYDDPVTNQSLRWDPADDSRYALQWRDPSGDPSRKERGGMLGANRLAIEGLPLVSCAPVNGSLQTTGFVGRGSRNTFWVWPIWAFPISLDVCRTILAHSALVNNKDGMPNYDQLRHLGICAAYRSQRITVGKFRNFTPAKLA
ncbi:MAG: hypothetical protein L0Z50_23820 [Verrucomicrobiales bacterium]|nr:hypothetical protein [Verrucomicrobiales bacterium]